MLYDAQITKVVVDSLKTRYNATSSAEMPPIICDPVCVSTSGHTLLHEDALDVLIFSLFPISTLITPNKSEAELLLSRMGGEVIKIHNLESMVFAAEVLLSFAKCQAVLLKGGHITAHMKDVVATQDKFSVLGLKVVKQNLLGENMEILSAFSADLAGDQELVVDILLEKEDNRKTMFVRPRIDSSSTHGTGCTLSSAIASELAKGSSRTLVSIYCSYCHSECSKMLISRESSRKRRNVHLPRHPIRYAHRKWPWPSKPPTQHPSFVDPSVSGHLHSKNQNTGQNGIHLHLLNFWQADECAPIPIHTYAHPELRPELEGIRRT